WTGSILMIQIPTAGSIFYTQFAPTSVQAICDAIKNALINCGWTSVAKGSTATLIFNGVPSNGQICIIGSVTYTFLTTLTGTANQVHIGGTAAACANNFYEAVNAGAGSGTDYSAATTANSQATASLDSSTVVRFTSTATGFA